MQEVRAQIYKFSLRFISHMKLGVTSYIMRFTIVQNFDLLWGSVLTYLKCMYVWKVKILRYTRINSLIRML